MNRQSTRLGPALLAAAAIIVAGCGVTGTVATPPAATPTPPTAAPVTAAPTVHASLAPTPAPTTTPAGAMAAGDVAYESANDVLIPGVLDVYAPPAGGPYPVVGHVPRDPVGGLEGFPGRARPRGWPQLGFVVFDADWGHTAGSPDPASTSMPTRRRATPRLPVPWHSPEVARGRLRRRPREVIVFGHSGGSNVGSVVAVSARAQPSKGCLGGRRGRSGRRLRHLGRRLPPRPRRKSQILEADRRVMDQMTPWSVPRQPAGPCRWRMLLSEDPGPQVRGPLPAAARSRATWRCATKTARLLRLVEKTGVFKDEEISVADYV